MTDSKIEDVVVRLKKEFDRLAVCHCGNGVGGCDNHDFVWMEDDVTRMLYDARWEIERLRIERDAARKECKESRRALENEHVLRQFNHDELIEYHKAVAANPL